jgi:hypothetical protein
MTRGTAWIALILPLEALARRRGGGSHGSWADLLDSYVVWIIATFVALVVLIKVWGVLSKARVERRSRVEAARQRGRMGR